MLTSLVIPLKSNTKHQCLELKYSLRSIDKHLKNVGEVFIVTDVLPDWIKDVTMILGKDYIGQKQKEYNIACKLCSACLDERVSNPFLATNDDIYLLEDFDANTFPYFYYGTIQDRLNQRKPNEIYSQACLNTQNVLLKAHRETLYFDVHVPILYDKELFLRVIKGLPSWRGTSGYIIKSLYGNMLQVDGISYPDMKVKVPWHRSQIEGRKWFSNNNLVLNDHLFDYLEELFPVKSRWEI